MTETELIGLFNAARRSIFRLQTLPSYAVDEEREAFDQFLAGMPLPKNPEADPWLQSIQAKVEAGVRVTNLHVIPDQLTPYLRFAIDWSYVYRHRAGEQILFISAEDARRCSPPVSQDFWLFDDRDVVVMRYDAEGNYLGADGVDVAEKIDRYLAICEAAQQHAFELQSVLARRRRGLIY